MCLSHTGNYIIGRVYMIGIHSIFFISAFSPAEGRATYKRAEVLSSEYLKISLAMAFFLVDVEFRKKAKHLLTTKEVLFCIFFCVFALVPWMDIAVFAGHRLFGRNGTFLPDGFWDDDKTTMFSDFFDTTSTSDDTPTMEGTSCSPKFPKLCVPKT